MVPGKSTLAKVMAGHEDYEVISGQILMDRRDLLAMSIDERSRAGFFLAFQYPYEIPGVTNANFLAKPSGLAWVPGKTSMLWHSTSAFTA